MELLFSEVGSHASLARTIEHLGTPRFFKQLILLLQQWVPFDNALAIHYPSDAAPRALEEYDALPHTGPAAMLIYLDGLYLLDPFFQACREGIASGL